MKAALKQFGIWLHQRVNGRFQITRTRPLYQTPDAQETDE